MQGCKQFGSFMWLGPALPADQMNCATTDPPVVKQLSNTTTRLMNDAPKPVGCEKQAEQAKQFYDMPPFISVFPKSESNDITLINSLNMLTNQLSEFTEQVKRSNDIHGTNMYKLVNNFVTLSKRVTQLENNQERMDEQVEKGYETDMDKLVSQ
jgi:hypothetical protein